MKKTVIILGLVTAILSAILSVLPIFKLAIFPGVLALVCGIAALILARKQSSSTQTIQLIFLIVILAFSLSIYKTIFTKAEVGNTEQLKELEVEKVEEAKEELLNVEITE